MILKFCLETAVHHQTVLTLASLAITHIKSSLINIHRKPFCEKKMFFPGQPRPIHFLPSTKIKQIILTHFNRGQTQGFSQDFETISHFCGADFFSSKYE